MKVVVLFSGGLDSTTVLAYCLSKGYEVTALSFDYGQRHSHELKYSQILAKEYKVEQYIVPISLPWGGSSLLDKNLQIPHSLTPGIPSTYVPGRNTIFISFALSLAEALDAKAVFLGINSIDYSGYPDCRPEYLSAYQSLAELSSRVSIEGEPIQIFAPLLFKDKKEIIHLAQKLKVPIEKTYSCYNGAETVCGLCDSCRIRQKALQEVLGGSDASVA